MQASAFPAARVEEEIVTKVQLAIHDPRTISTYNNNDLAHISKMLDLPIPSSPVKQELEVFKNEKEEAECRKDQAETLRLRVFNSIDDADLFQKTEQAYNGTKAFLGNYPVPPLGSFYCPIMHEVMEDPVEVCTGQTYERSAIEKWFREGHFNCPVTNEELENLSLRSNIMLRRAIEEWKDRNTIIELTTMETKLKCADEEEVVMHAITKLQDLCEQKNLHRCWITTEGLVPVLVNLLRTSKRDIRKKTLTILSTLVKDHDDIKEKVSKEGAIGLAVRSLSRDDGEARKAVDFLLEISRHPKLRTEISTERGCIFLLVTRTNSEDPQTAAKAEELLDNLCDDDANVVMMAEANYIKPFIQRLLEGSHLTKIDMANALSTMQLVDRSRSNLVNEGVLPPLVAMASVGNLESRSAALGALKNLSSCQENRDPLVKAGVVKPLLEILFSAKSVVMTLREHAAVIFANLATASISSVSTYDFLGNFIESNETINQLLSLINLTGPTIQNQIFKSLNGICCSSGAGEVRTLMREGGSCQLLLSFCEVNDPEVRLNALKLLYCLTNDRDNRDLAKDIGENKVKSFSSLTSSSTREEEKVAAMGVLSNLPVDDLDITEWLLEAGMLTTIIDILSRCVKNGVKGTANQLVENALAILIRFTLPTNLQLQKLTAEFGVIPLLVKLLITGTALAKCRAAVSLGQLSENSIKLTSPIKRQRGWFCFGVPPDAGCRVHGGVCSIESSFCLVEAEAIPAVIHILEEGDEGAAEASLNALATLLNDACWEKGCVALAETQGITSILRLLTIGSAGAQEKAVWILERVFRKEKYRSEYGSRAQMALISLTQSGTISAKRLAAKVLAHFNILHEQSSYF